MFSSDYADLREHFRIDHYLCEEGECEGGHVQFTNAFNTEIDLKAHCAQTHSRNMSKAQIKEVRTLDIDIQMPRRRKPHERGRSFLLLLLRSQSHAQTSSPVLTRKSAVR